MNYFVIKFALIGKGGMIQITTQSDENHCKLAHRLWGEVHNLCTHTSNWNLFLPSLARNTAEHSKIYFKYLVTSMLRYFPYRLPMPRSESNMFLKKREFSIFAIKSLQNNACNVTTKLNLMRIYTITLTVNSC